MGKQVKELLKNKDLTVLTDRGYFISKDIVDPQDVGMTPLVPSVDSSGSEKNRHSQLIVVSL